MAGGLSLCGAAGLMAGLAIELLVAEHAHQMAPTAVATVPVGLGVGLITGPAIAWLLRDRPDARRRMWRWHAASAASITAVIFILFA